MRHKLTNPELLSELEIYQLSPFIDLKRAFDISDPSSLQDACHHEPSKHDLTRHETPISSVVRASDRCTKGHNFDPVGDSDFFIVPRSKQTDYLHPS